MWISYLQIKNEIFYRNKWSRSKNMLLEYYTTSVFTVNWQSWVNLNSCYFYVKVKIDINLYSYMNCKKFDYFAILFILFH